MSRLTPDSLTATTPKLTIVIQHSVRPSFRGIDVADFAADQVSTPCGDSTCGVARSLSQVPDDGEAFVLEVVAGDVGLRTESVDEHIVEFCSRRGRHRVWIVLWSYGQTGARRIARAHVEGIGSVVDRRSVKAVRADELRGLGPRGPEGEPDLRHP